MHPPKRFRSLLLAPASLAFLLIPSLLIAVASAAWSTPPVAAGTTRTYYIAADEVDWDYAPSGSNQITGRPFGDQENIFVEGGPARIGRVYRKARYREYTDASFTALKPVAPCWEHLGVLGPVIRAEVGDSIRVVFKNQASFPFSMHAHGVFYEKRSEGAPYDDGAEDAGDAVPPGQTVTYTWEVPERAGPGPMDPSSILWMYHSHVDEPADTNAGLIGPIIITRRGAALPDGRPDDLDREFVTLFTIFDENASPYLEHNIRTFAGAPELVRVEDERFEESNLMHSINGFVYGNLPLATVTMRRGKRVRWYVLGMGTEADLHTPHWHGQTLLHLGMRTDGVELLPMSMKTLDMVPDSPGVWLYHCHVNDHITAGMLARFEVQP
jgi:manganese oxidase